MVDHESKDGKGRLHLLLVHYQPVRGASKVIMPVGLIQKRMTLDNAVNIVAQAITTTNRPQSWMRRSVYFAVCDPSAWQISFHTVDKEDMLDHNVVHGVGHERIEFLWAAEQNRPMYGV